MMFFFFFVVVSLTGVQNDNIYLTVFISKVRRGNYAS